MSTVSACSYDTSSASTKRKRGRPRKDEAPGSESSRRALQNPNSNVELVGQQVSGSFVGVFDSGYLLTVQVGSSGPIMTGLVFDPRLSVPISAENDIAPHLPMLRRNDLFPPTEDDFINRGTVSPQVDMEPKDVMNLAPRHSSQISQGASETMGVPTKTLKIFLEGAAAETSYHPQSQVENEDTPNIAEISVISKPSHDYNTSAVSMETSLEASKDIPADIFVETPPGNIPKVSDAFNAIPHASSESLNFPKAALSTSTEGLTFKIEPRAVSKSFEASLTAPKVNLDEPKSPVASREADFEGSQVLDNQPVETQGMLGENLSSQKSEEPSEEVNNSPMDYNSISEIPMEAKPHNIAVAEQEDDHTLSEASTFQP